MTGLFSSDAMNWDPETLRRESVPEGSLPDLNTAGSIIGALSADSARLFGLTYGTPLVLGPTDGICAELGVGVVDEGEAYAYLGTAAAIAAPIVQDRAPVAPGVSVIPGSSAGRWRLAGLCSTGASAVEWLQVTLGLKDERAVGRHASRSPTGSNGVAFLPALAGADGAWPDPEARAVFAGISLATTQADMARAVLEGIAVQLAWYLQHIRASGPGVAVVHVTGGGSRSDVWLAILADALGLDVARSPEPDGGLRGAAMFALSAIGLASSAEDIARRTRPRVKTIHPRRANMVVYEQLAAVLDLTRRSFVVANVDARLGEYRRSLTKRDTPTRVGVREATR
jgi:xylulokinase